MPSYYQNVSAVQNYIVDRPYCIPLHILLCMFYLALGYPDLAAGQAYKTLMLADAVQDSADEYHDDACRALSEIIAYHPLVERISLLKSEIQTDPAGRAYRNGDDEDQQADVEVAVWLREHYLPLM